MVRVKICGLREPGHCLAAARLGAHLLGVVLAPSRRWVSLEQAKEIGDALRGEVKPPLLVGVFVNQPLEEVNRLADLCGLDYVQLSGDEPPEYCRGLSRPWIKALRWASEEREEVLARRMDSYLAVSSRGLFLLDTPLPGVYGGSGQAWQWGKVAPLAQRYPLLIAGGLTPENVGQVVKDIWPWGVDVSSGVETDGIKDEAKIKAFVEAVRNAEGKNGD